MLSVDDFKKVEMKAGKILSAEKVEGSEKLLKLSVDFGLRPQSGPSDHLKQSDDLGIKPQSGSPDHLVEQDDIGRDIRQVLSGIAKYVQPEDLVGVTCGFVTNLEPRSIMGMESQAMIMAVSGEPSEQNPNGFFSLLKVSDGTPPGSTVR